MAADKFGADDVKDSALFSRNVMEAGTVGHVLRTSAQFESCYQALARRADD